MNKKQLQFDRLLAVLHQNSDYITAKIFIQTIEFI